MAEARIPVDLFNPGQVFACLGLLEAAEVLLGDAEGGFDWTDETDLRFGLRAEGKQNPVGAVLEFLARATVSSLAPARSKQSTSKWHVPTMLLADDDAFPFPDPPSPATLPALVAVANNASLVINHWGDVTDRDAVKFWAGSGGYPGAALARDAIDLVRDRIGDAISDPFSLPAPQSRSFRFDWRRDYVPMDVGFSPNQHGELTMIGFPLVEILAAIGLDNARPERLGKLDYRYGVIGDAAGRAFFSPLFVRAALGCAKLPFSQRTFRMRLDWPGQENQARCITNVTEENRP